MTAIQLQRLIDRAGMSQRGAAREVGISERQMRRYCAASPTRFWLADFRRQLPRSTNTSSDAGEQK